MNYRIALNPEIFFRYSVFKARVKALGRKWDGTLSDWLDLATKDILSVYGLYRPFPHKSSPVNSAPAPVGNLPREMFRVGLLRRLPPRLARAIEARPFSILRTLSQQLPITQPLPKEVGKAMG